MRKVNLAEAFETFHDTWHPRIVGELIWHHHDIEDELLIVPHGVEHKPVALPGTKLLLLELKTTVNTGEEGGERTAVPQWI